MRDDAPSRTAQWVAAARGMGRLLPEAVRLADDPYGLAFASPRIARLVDRTRDTRPDRAQALAHVPGLSLWIAYMQVRTRLIDDVVRGFVAAGGRQLVVLGAGYDCRALRMPELAGARVFEVDHPATQRHKRAVLDQLGAHSPVHYLAWDFETHPMDDLPGALADTGHDPAALTLTIWEGVTMYLTEAAIDASLRAIASWSAPGALLALTYMTRQRLRSSVAMRAVRAVVRSLGEPFRFGWEPDELPGYLAARGFVSTSDVSTSDAARRLLPPELAAQIVQTDRVATGRRT
ncbi:MAG TPA: SAM-dependent methyltransferase [Kofleriaceae bacterium]|jgi:methyltransferase (TIGR00027 family)|nr:SAM-dependent methyltransferase [Kofleriaceae bacterium]